MSELTGGTGLEDRYLVARRDGKPVVWAFVLEDTDPLAKRALYAYADRADEYGKHTLASQLRQRAMQLPRKRAIDELLQQGTSFSQAYELWADSSRDRTKGAPVTEEHKSAFLAGLQWLLQRVNDESADLATHVAELEQQVHELEASSLTHQQIVQGINLWVDDTASNPDDYLEYDEALQEHLEQRLAGLEPSYGKDGLAHMLMLLDKQANQQEPDTGQ